MGIHRVLLSVAVFVVTCQAQDICSSGLPVADGVCSNGGEIPGTAGVDYPVYAQVPSTNFNCGNIGVPGYYADPESGCQAFYICGRQGKGTGFLCPNGTLFNQEVLVCDWWTHVDCNQAVNYYGINQQILAEMDAANERLGVNQRERERLAAAGINTNNNLFGSQNRFNPNNPFNPRNPNSPIGNGQFPSRNPYNPNNPFNVNAFGQNLNGPFNPNRQLGQNLNGPFNPNGQLGQNLNGPFNPNRQLGQNVNGPFNPNRQLGQNLNGPFNPNRQLGQNVNPNNQFIGNKPFGQNAYPNSPFNQNRPFGQNINDPLSSRNPIGPNFNNFGPTPGPFGNSRFPQTNPPFNRFGSTPVPNPFNPFGPSTPGPLPLPSGPLPDPNAVSNPAQNQQFSNPRPTQFAPNSQLDPNSFNTNPFGFPNGPSTPFAPGLFPNSQFATTARPNGPFTPTSIPYQSTIGSSNFEISTTSRPFSQEGVSTKSPYGLNDESPTSQVGLPSSTPYTPTRPGSGYNYPKPNGQFQANQPDREYLPPFRK